MSNYTLRVNQGCSKYPAPWGGDFYLRMGVLGQSSRGWQQIGDIVGNCSASARAAAKPTTPAPMTTQSTWSITRPF